MRKYNKDICSYLEEAFREGFLVALWNTFRIWLLHCTHSTSAPPTTISHLSMTWRLTPAPSFYSCLSSARKPRGSSKAKVTSRYVSACGTCAVAPFITGARAVGWESESMPCLHGPPWSVAPSLLPWGSPLPPSAGCSPPPATWASLLILEQTKGTFTLRAFAPTVHTFIFFQSLLRCRPSRETSPAHQSKVTIPSSPCLRPPYCAVVFFFLSPLAL